MFKYLTTVNIIKHDNLLFYTFYTQAVNQLSPYEGFRSPPSGTCVEHLLLHIFKLKQAVYTKILQSKRTVWNLIVYQDDYTYIEIPKRHKHPIISFKCKLMKDENFKSNKKTCAKLKIVKFLYLYYNRLLIDYVE